MTEISSFDVSLEDKAVKVTSDQLSSDEILAIIKKCGKETTYVGEE